MQYPLTTQRWIARSTVLILIAMVGLPVSGQRPSELSEQARAVAVQWLLSNCEVGEGNRLKFHLQEFRAELEPFFLQALHQGPDEKQLSDVRRASDAQYQQRQDVLKSGKLPLKDEDRRAAHAVTRDQYVAQSKEDFVNRYKPQAVAGLGVVGGPKAKAELQLLSKDEKSPLRISALEALKSMSGGTKKQGPR
jgi:hypothetical protein